MAQHSHNENDLNNAARQSSDLLRAHANRRHARSDFEPTRELRPTPADETAPLRGSNYAGSNPQPADSPKATRSLPKHSGTHASESARPSSITDFIRRNSTYILSVCAVVVIAVLMITFLKAFSPVPTGIEATVEQLIEHEKPPIDWDNLDNSTDRYRYSIDGQVVSTIGIDVSEYQHEIDWNAVAGDGIDFAMIRLGYRGATGGELYLDEQYEANIDGAKKAGVGCGVYFFSQARTTDEAIEEADYVLKNLNGIKLEYPIAFDSEEAVMGIDAPRTADLDPKEMSAIAEAFCDRLRDAGYKTIIYGNYFDLARYDFDELEHYEIWWAEYDALVPDVNTEISMWQYANSGQISGIDYAVDMNIDFFGTLRNRY